MELLKARLAAGKAGKEEPAVPIALAQPTADSALDETAAAEEADEEKA